MIFILFFLKSDSDQILNEKKKKTFPEHCGFLKKTKTETVGGF